VIKYTKYTKYNQNSWTIIVFHGIMVMFVNNRNS